MIFQLTLFLALSATLFDNGESHKDSVLNIGWLFNRESRTEKKSAVCETENCKLMAKDFLESMNTSVDPCQDFYQYVCGQWNNPDIIPPWQNTWNVFDKYQMMVSERIKGILETKPESNDILPVRQAKKWYRSCMNTDALEKRGLKPIESVLIQVGGWPMIIDAEEWDENDHSWQQIEHYYFEVTGSYTFHKITPAVESSGWFPFRKRFSKFTIDTQYEVYIEDHLEEYAEFILGVATDFTKLNTAKISEDTLKKDIKDLLEFEVALYKLEVDFDTTNVGDFLNDYEEALGELDGDFKKIEFPEILTRIFDVINKDVDEKTTINLPTPQYYAQLTKILNETPKRTIINYIHWNFVRDMLEYTTEEMRKLKNQLEDSVYEAVEQKPRWLQCTDEMKMVRASSYAFVQKFYTPEIDKEVHDLTENSRKELENLIDKTSWMDKETKRLSKEKLKAMKVFIGFPEWYKNRTYVINSYKGLLIGSNLFDNILSYKKYETKKALYNALDPVDEDEEDPNEEIDPTIVNAFYSPEQNIIELPAANFQPPLFTSRIPRSVNYGFAGTGIGHEMGHGFDVTGINFGENGTTTEISSKMLSLFFKRAECFLDQYNNYMGVSEPVYSSWLRYLFNYQGNSFGAKTQGENIADVTGIEAVYHAYLKTLEEAPDTKLPGFEQYTDKQMFFISFAATWCEIATEEGAQQLLEQDVHSPGRLRVIGSVSNTNAFAKEFNCPKGSPMNPEDKCTIWTTDTGESFSRSKLRKRKRVLKIKN